MDTQNSNASTTTVMVILIMMYHSYVMVILIMTDYLTPCGRGLVCKGIIFFIFVFDDSVLLPPPIFIVSQSIVLVVDHILRIGFEML